MDLRNKLLYKIKVSYLFCHIVSQQCKSKICDINLVSKVNVSVLLCVCLLTYIMYIISDLCY